MELNECRNGSPTKYRPGTDGTAPRFCSGYPSSSAAPGSGSSPSRCGTGAPDDVRDVDDAAVGEHRLSVLDPDRPLEDTLDAGGFEVSALDPDERPSAPAISCFTLRPIGVSTVSTASTRNAARAMHTHPPALERDGICPCPFRREPLPARATSNAMSPPECAAPTTSTGPGCSCSGPR